MKKNHAARSHLLAITTAAALLGLAAGSAAAAEARKADATKPAKAVPAESAMRAYIDPATGQLRQPTVEETSAQVQADASAVEPGKVTAKTIVRADGVVGLVDAKGLLLETVTATVAANGKLTVSYSGGDGNTADAEVAPAATVEEK